MINSVLKQGNIGQDVAEWQNFLHAFFTNEEASSVCELIADGFFGQETLKLTIRYQNLRNLSGDGIVGRQTLSSAIGDGLGVLHDDNYPASSLLKPLTLLEKHQQFGVFTYVADPVPQMLEAIKITGRSNFTIVRLDTPILQSINISHVLVNDKCKVSFMSLINEWHKQDLLKNILSFDGMYVPRFVRGSRSTLSNHSWGTAFDINARWNPMGKVGPASGSKGSVYDLVKIANDLGWFWGGHFTARPDPMHFECTKID
jgi:hypothetical protein